MRARLALALTLVPLSLAACGDDTAPGDDLVLPPVTEPTPPPSTEPTAPPSTLDDPLALVAGQLADAERRWAAAGVSAYSMELREICFCPDNLTRVDVVDSVALWVRPAGDAAVDPDVEPVARDVEELFDELRRAVDDDVARIDATFDDSTGRPLSYWIDRDEAIADEEYGVEVTEFTPTTAMPGAEWFDTALPCGHGFAVAAGDETLILDIKWTGTLSFADAPISIDVEVPERNWIGEIRVGADLGANWCDDVLEPTEPTPRIDERWDITGGQLVAASEPGNPGVVTGAITGLEVTTDDGTVLSLGDVELENQAWGVYAG